MHIGKILALAFALAPALGVVAKAADYPASVKGAYSANVAGNPNFTLKITSQTPTGQACDNIDGYEMLNGVIYQYIHGFYCPSTGRISFLRGRQKDPNSQFLLQVGVVVTGNVSSAAAGPFPLVIGGVQAVYYTGGVFGEASFFAEKK